jgi:hypothetical protein
MRLARTGSARRLLDGLPFGGYSPLWWPATNKLRRRRIVVTAAVLGAGLLLYALSRPQHAQCQVASCDLLVDFANSVLVALLAYAGYFAFTRGWVLFRYQRRARREPQGLLSGHHDIPELAQISRRSGLLLQIGERIRDRDLENAPPRSRDVPMILGDIGAGKSTFMVTLAAYLARRGVVPILISLRNERPPFDIPELARKRFLRHIDDPLLSAAAAERLWRQLWHRHLVVVLVDGLDEALGQGQLIDALELADGLVDRSSTRLIAASRPESLVSLRGFAVLELEPLSRTELIGRLAVKHRSAPSLSESEASLLVETLGLPSAPFYLEVWNRLVQESGLSSSGRRADAISQKRLRELVEAICGAPGSSPTPSHDRARVRLLDRHLDSRIERAEHELGTSPEETEACVARLAALAYEHLGSKSIDRDQLVGGRDAAAREQGGGAIILGRRLGLLAESQTRDSSIRFSHPIFQAYLASMHLGESRLVARRSPVLHASRASARPDENRRRGGLVERLLAEEGSHGDEVFIALRLFGAHAETDARTSAATIELLLAAAAKTASLSSALKRLAAAVRIASSASAAGLSEGVFERVLAASGDALAATGIPAAGAVEEAKTPNDEDELEASTGDAPAARLRLMRALANLASSSGRSTQVYRLLWDRREDRSYATRWQIVEAFALGGQKAFDAIGQPISKLMDDIERSLADGPGGEARLERHLAQLSTIAKFLPSIAARLADGDDDDAYRKLKDLIDLVNRLVAQGLGLGVEASLAQGFKFAAPRRGARVLDPLMFKQPHRSFGRDGRPNRLARRTPAPFGSEGRAFWYSRMNLLQAAARRHLTLSADNENRALVGDIEDHLKKAGKHEAHPFVQVVAALCRKATERPGEADSFIWEDESVEVASAATSLNATAHSLLADVVIALNMNEQGRREGRRAEDRRESFATASRLPACFRGTERWRILSTEGDCVGNPSCGFGLCGYRPELAQTAAYRPICERFYDHQVQLSWHREPLPWQRGVDGEALASFWRAMGEREGRRDEIV